MENSVGIKLEHMTVLYQTWNAKAGEKPGTGIEQSKTQTMQDIGGLVGK